MASIIWLLLPSSCMTFLITFISQASQVTCSFLNNTSLPPAYCLSIHFSSPLYWLRCHPLWEPVPDSSPGLSSFSSGVRPSSVHLSSSGSLTRLQLALFYLPLYRHQAPLPGKKDTLNKFVMNKCFWVTSHF